MGIYKTGNIILIVLIIILIALKCVVCIYNFNCKLTFTRDAARYIVFLNIFIYLLLKRNTYA